MTEIRTKDKLFLAVALPLALAAAYLWLVRPGLGDRVAALRAEVGALVAAEDFELERAQAERAAKAAAEELAAEEAAPVPAARVKGEATAGEAAREAALLAVFRAAGLGVVSSGPVGEDRPTKATEILAATGHRPVPVRRAYTLEGRYPQLVAALKALEAQAAAVIVTRVASSSGGRGVSPRLQVCWELEAVL